jgi:hypothetical protein
MILILGKNYEFSKSFFFTHLRGRFCFRASKRALLFSRLQEGANMNTTRVNRF